MPTQRGYRERLTISAMRIAKLDTFSLQAIPHGVGAKPEPPTNFHARQSGRIETRHQVDDVGCRRLES